MDCLFCKIIEGNIPALKIYETSHCLAFLDINPRTMGHTLVIPKKHYQNLMEMPDDQLAGLFSTAKQVASRITTKLGATGFNIFLNNGHSAGQVVQHVHVHIMPRYGEEGVSIEAPFPVQDALRKTLEELARNLRE
jgi:histidine triad (HIT) family protein